MRLAGWMVVIGACSGGEEPEQDVQIDYREAGDFDVTLLSRSMELPGDRDGFPSAVPLNVYLPAGAPEPLPVLWFNHGFALGPADYHDTLVHLASWGWLVLAPTWDAGLSARSHLGLAEDQVAAHAWLLQASIEGVDASIDYGTVAVMGHSRGGKQAIHAAILDPRFKAVFGLDPVDAPPPFGEVDPVEYPSVAPELMPGLTVPLGMVGLGRGAEGTVPCAPAGDNFQAYADGSSAGLTLVTLPDAGHADVVDDCAGGGSGLVCASCVLGVDPVRALSASRAWALAFLEAELRGDEAAAGNFDAATVEVWYPGAVVERR